MENPPAWWNALISVGGLVGSIVTAVATIFLWKVTRLLAHETTRMVDAASQPHVVATLDPSPWSVRFFELNVNNTGTGTPYDIQVKFEPPLKNKDNLEGTGSPIDRISVLKPGQGINSYAADYPAVKGVTYQVTVSWRRSAQENSREENAYTLNLSDMENMSRIEGDPLVKIAEHLKRLQEDNRKHQNSRSRLEVNAYFTSDRLHEARVAKRRVRASHRNDPEK